MPFLTTRGSPPNVLMVTSAGRLKSYRWTDLFGLQCIVIRSIPLGNGQRPNPQSVTWGAQTNMQQVPRFRFSIRFMLVLVTLAAVLLASRTTLTCYYHQWALQRAASGENGWYVGSFEQHIKELARLGRYQKRAFVLENLAVDSAEARRLFVRLRSVRGGNAWFSMGPFDEEDASETPENITVICSPEEMYIYQALIAQADSALANAQDDSLQGLDQPNRR